MLLDLLWLEKKRPYSEILAEKIGIDIGNITKYKKSRTNLVNKLAEALDIDPKYLLNGVSNKKNKLFTEEDVQSESYYL